MKPWAAFVLLGVLSACAGGDADKSNAQTARTILATTHTLEDSGLLDSIAAGFRRDNPNERLDIVVAGSGEVLTIGKRGDADVLLTHAPADEEAFVTAGYGMARRPVAHNEFLIVGPPEDPANIRNAPGAVEAFARIRRSQQAFVSRGDDSGTDKKEKSIWKLAGITPDETHFVIAGTGMADALRIADQRRAYILTDLATFLTLKQGAQSKGKQALILEDLVHGDSVLRNDYSVIVISNARNAKGANAFADWITGANAQAMIGEYGRAKFGRALFTPDTVRQP